MDTIYILFIPCRMILKLVGIQRFFLLPITLLFINHLKHQKEDDQAPSFILWQLTGIEPTTFRLSTVRPQLEHLEIKIYFFTFTYYFLSNPALE